MLTLKDFSKSYSGNLIIKIDSLHVGPGLHWIKGINGSGKTTLFRSIAGLHPSEGEISFSDGVSLRKHPVAYRRLVNYAEAEPLYPGFLTGKDLFHFVGIAKGITPDQHALVDQLGLDAYYRNACETYSSGMLKKLSLVLAFLGKPRVIILDEPLIMLDEAARTKLFGLINVAVTEKNMVVLISSHQEIENDVLPVQQRFVIQNKTLEAF